MDTAYEVLAEKAEQFGRRFPGLAARFCRIMGRRISHIAGSPDVTGGCSTRIEVLPGLLMMVEGDVDACGEAVGDFAAELADIALLQEEFS